MKLLINGDAVFVEKDGAKSVLMALFCFTRFLGRLMQGEIDGRVNDMAAENCRL